MRNAGLDDAQAGIKIAGRNINNLKYADKITPMAESKEELKEYVKAVYCHPAYLTYMQSTSGEMPDWMKHKLESRLPGEISITSDMQMAPPSWQKAKN